jgi:hypothetical protein
MATAEIGATLRETVHFEGVGLHTGEVCRIAVHPVLDRRTSCAITIRKGAQRFPARWDYVVDATRATVLGNGATCISTVEHLMAALWITGITHCEIELLQGNEIPILDGSALPFVEVLERVKAGDLPSPRPSTPLVRGEREVGAALTPSPSPTEGERGTPLPDTRQPLSHKGGRMLPRPTCDSHLWSAEASLPHSIQPARGEPNGRGSPCLQGEP